MTNEPDDDIRELLAHRAAGVKPRGTYADLEAKLAAQHGGRRVTGRHVVLGIAAALALVVGGVAVALATGDDGQQVQTADGPSTTSTSTTVATTATLPPVTVTVPQTATTTEATTTTTTVPVTTTTIPPTTTTTVPAGPAPLDDAAAVYVGGIGGLRLPTGIAQAEQAAGRMIDGDLESGASVCSYGTFVDGPTDVRLMIENENPDHPGSAHELGDAGRVVRLDVGPQGKVRAVGEGGFDASVGIGSTEAEVLAAFPTAEVEPHKYETEGHYVTIVDDPDAPTVSLLFETVRGVVTEFHTGDWSSVSLVEGCS